MCTVKDLAREFKYHPEYIRKLFRDEYICTKNRKKMKKRDSFGMQSIYYEYSNECCERIRSKLKKKRENAG